MTNILFLAINNIISASSSGTRRIRDTTIFSILFLSRIVMLLFTALGLLWSLDSYGRLRKKRRSEAHRTSRPMRIDEVYQVWKPTNSWFLWFRTGDGPPKL